MGPPLKRAERAEARRELILFRYNPKRRDFINFVLGQYVQVGERELDGDKLPELLQLKYGSAADADQALGSVGDIRVTFRGFQQELYGKLE